MTPCVTSQQSPWWSRIHTVTPLCPQSLLLPNSASPTASHPHLSCLQPFLPPFETAQGKFAIKNRVIGWVGAVQSAEGLCQLLLQRSCMPSRQKQGKTKGCLTERESSSPRSNSVHTSSSSRRINMHAFIPNHCSVAISCFVPCCLLAPNSS